jgi:nucleotide-binding universal stress UspA family protein
MASMIMNRTWSLSNRERQAERRPVSIICPIGFMARDLFAVRYAAQMARQRRGRLIIVHVVPPDVATSCNDTETRNTRCEEALARLEEYVPRPSGVQCEWVVLQGGVPEQLVEFAAGSERPQIVMATRRREADCASLGETVQTVLRQASCPVVIVNDDDLDSRQTALGHDRRVCVVS